MGKTENPYQEGTRYNQIGNANWSLKIYGVCKDYVIASNKGAYPFIKHHKDFKIYLEKFKFEIWINPQITNHE